VEWDEPKLLVPGLVLLFLSIALFAFASRRWPDPAPDPRPMRPSLEWTLFGAAILFGAFMRFFRIGSMPSGLFVDQGYQGLAALKILHEGWRPFYVEETLHAPAYALYQQAAWFGIFGATTESLRSFFATVSLLSLPLVYWTFRQLFGVRTALVSLFVLAVMRWNFNFSRNGFPSIQILFYMFATLSLILYAYRARRRWAWVTAAVVGALGLYTYQAYKLFPVLLACYAAYEFLADRKYFKAQMRHMTVFAVVFAALSLPLVAHFLTQKDAMYREGGLNIMNKMAKEGSVMPLVQNWTRTALMFNRRGDVQPRHNLQDHQMVDTLSGILMWFGLVLALRMLRIRKYFYVVSGFLVMSLPCLLSVDPAHGNRMVGITPFLAVLIALPMMFLWDRFVAAWKEGGRVVFLPVLALALGAVLVENYDLYFNKQARHYYGWKEYHIEETTIGQRIAERGDTTDFYLTPYFYGHHTIEFLGYDHEKTTFPFIYPDHLAPLRSAEGRAAAFAFEPEKKPVLDLMKTLFPGARAEIVPDLKGDPLFYWLWLSEEDVAASRGLRVTGASVTQASGFPASLPPGPYSAVFSGSVYLPHSGPHSFRIRSNAVVSMSVSGRPVVPGEARNLTRGYHPVSFRVAAPAGPVNLALSATNTRSGTFDMGSESFTTLVCDRGMRGTYWNDADFRGEPQFERIDPLLNFTNGNELVIKDLPLTAEWRGTLNVRQAGTYEFVAKANDFSELTLDGRRLFGFAPQVKQEGRARVQLTAGPHDLRVRMKKLEGYGAMLDLNWIPPGRQTPEAIPNALFGVLP
jgi:4-amino-4-deoxy-L-arabinose transferase-like glycosyltransferase